MASDGVVVRQQEIDLAASAQAQRCSITRTSRCRPRPRSRRAATVALVHDDVARQHHADLEHDAERRPENRASVRDAIMATFSTSSSAGH